MTTPSTPRSMPSVITGLVRAMRPKQWAKNGLIFIPVLFDRQISISQPNPFLRVLAAFALFCVSASAIYLINDVVDVERDRLHPKKRNRPIASGQLPIQVAIVAAVIMPIIAIVGALL